MAQMKKLSLAIAALSLFGAHAAHAVEIQAGDWKLGIGGNVNGFITSDSPDNKPNVTVVGGLAGNGSSSTVGIANGLLPNALVISASSRQDDLDVNATIGLYPSIAANGALQNGAGINSRQGFLTFGDKSWGTIKIGRDLGIFGSDAILSDATLLSIGSGSGGGYGGQTSLGRIGFGYLYADWIPQVSYSTPNVNGFAASAGVFQGMKNASISTSVAVPVYSATKQPQLQAKVTYDVAASGVNSHLWAGVLTQKFDKVGNGPQGYDATAFEVGGKFGISDFEGVVYYYDGEGVGTTALFFDGDDGLGNKRKSKGGYLQGSYKIGKVKLALSYGESKLDLTSAESANVNLVEKNSSSIASVYYSLTKSVTLVAEYVNTKSRNHNSQELKQDTVGLGGILFF